MKYTAEEVRDYADACRLAHKGPVIADMLTELAERIKVDESAAPVGFVMEATATRHKFGLLTQDLPPGAELFTHPPAQAAQVEDEDMDAQLTVMIEHLTSIVESQAAQPVAQSEVFVQVLASLIAAVRLLRSGGRKAAPSDTMFAFMLADYEKAIKAGRDLLATQQPREPS